MSNILPIQNLHSHAQQFLEDYHYCFGNNEAYTNDADDYIEYINSVLERNENMLQSILLFCEKNDISLLTYKKFMYANFKAKDLG